MRPSTNHPPERWASLNRVHKPGTGRPGPRDPLYTPYIVAFTRAFDLGAQIEDYGRRYSEAVFVCASQMGKTEGVLDVLGSQLDQRPAPSMYVGPDENFVRAEIAQRVDDMLKGAPNLRARLSLGRRSTMVRKWVGGVPLALAWAGSAAQLAGGAFKLVLFDEVDRMQTSVKGEGDPFTLGRARGSTFADAMLGGISTPLLGVIEIEKCPETGLEFWAKSPSEDVHSAIWRHFQTGTRHHWATPCPHCGRYFIVRMKQLRYPKDAAPGEVARSAYIECPCCQREIREEHKAEMNRRGVYVAPGQRITNCGRVEGAPPDAIRLSFWVSGLLSPWVTIGKSAAELVAAEREQKDAEIQGVVNTRFGECYAAGGGDVPLWQEVASLGGVYPKGVPPPWTQRITLCADVQKRRILFTLRAWGPHGRRHTVDYGELHGATVLDEVWEQLATVLRTSYDGRFIDRAFIDSGYRPGDPFQVPLNAVYAFCRRFKNRAYPTKGKSSADKPLMLRPATITRKGEVDRYGLDLAWIDTDWAKRQVFELIRGNPEAKDAWSLPSDVDPDFCRQIVSEARTITEAGAPRWVRRSRENHYLDCESMQEAMGYWLQAHRYRESAPTDAQRKQSVRERIEQIAARQRG